MKTNLREVENKQLAERLDELDMAMYRVFLADKQKAQESIKQIQQLQQLVTKVQGSEEFLSKLWASKYEIEGNFEIDEAGYIKRLPTAQIVE